MSKRVYKCKDLFHYGMVVFTPAALSHLDTASASRALARHTSGDWGDLDDEDKKRNNEAVKAGGQVLSSYIAPDGTKFWIITDDAKLPNTVTTFLLPEDY